MTIQPNPRTTVDDADSEASGALRKTTYRISAPRGYTVQHIQTVRYPDESEERESHTTNTADDTVDTVTISSDTSSTTSSTHTSTASTASTSPTSTMSFPAYISLRPKHVHWADESPKISRRHSYYAQPESKVHNTTYHKSSRHHRPSSPIVYEERRPTAVRSSSPRKYQYVESPTRVSSRETDRKYHATSQRAHQDHREPHIILRDSTHRSSRHDSRQETSSRSQSCKCRDCGRAFDSGRDLEKHHDRNGHFCREHNRCFASWNDHAHEYAHQKCPRQSCRNRASFASRQECREHKTNWHH